MQICQACQLKHALFRSIGGPPTVSSKRKDIVIDPLAFLLLDAPAHTYPVARCSKLDAQLVSLHDFVLCFLFLHFRDFSMLPPSATRVCNVVIPPALTITNRILRLLALKHRPSETSEAFKHYNAPAR